MHNFFKKLVLYEVKSYSMVQQNMLTPLEQFTLPCRQLLFCYSLLDLFTAHFLINLWQTN
jgi:hypothetical protein